MAYDFSMNSSLDIEVYYIGDEQQPVIVVDNLMRSPAAMLDYAEAGPEFQSDPKDFYPGVRKPIPPEYSNNLCQSVYETLHDVFDLKASAETKASSCVLSIATTAPQRLRPIQSVPHFDSCDPKKFAVVHYLCEPNHGGTSFYRHRQTGYEMISESRLQGYATTLKKEVVADKTVLFKYINGDTAQFERIATFDAKFNRAIFYRSNVLHSGNIQAENGLGSDSRTGRLTANTLISSFEKEVH